MEFVKITKTTSAQQVAEQLLGMIRRGLWKPGDRLPPERELIEKLDVGRSTVREALQILATLNIVQSSPGQGTFIKTPRGDEILRADLIGFLINDAVALDLLEAREMIEPQTVRLACLRASDEELAAIEELLDRHEAALKEGRSAADCAMLFHIMLAEASRSSVAATFLRSILELLNAQRQVENSPEFKYRELEEHRHILRLVRSRDAQAAADFLVRHIVDSVVIDVSYERWRDESKSKNTRA
jgi:GntR family transcriptional repressor for pyruvate dehydrogenase complex